MKRYLFVAATITVVGVVAAQHPDLVSRILAHLLDLEDR